MTVRLSAVEVCLRKLKTDYRLLNYKAKSLIYLNIISFITFKAGSISKFSL